MKILTIFHKSDLDGLCSEAIARKALGETSEYLGYEYGEPIPDLASYDCVYLLDISLPAEVMRANAAKLIWCDHHRTALDAMAGVVIRGHRIDGVAACRLTWSWFAWDAHAGHPDQGDLPTKDDYLARRVTEPYAVQLLGEYDVFRRDNPDTDLFQLGMQAEAAPLWDRLLWTWDPRLSDETNDELASLQEGYINQITRAGRAIQSYLNVQNAQISQERGFDVTWEGLRFRVLNTARSNSLTFAAALRPEHDGCLSYFWDGKKWRFSLYGVPGKPDVDLSVIAKRYGGGGHKQACGGSFGVNLPPELGGPRLVRIGEGLPPPSYP